MKNYFKINKKTSVITAAIITAVATIITAFISTTKTTINHLNNNFNVKTEKKHIPSKEKALSNTDVKQAIEKELAVAKERIISGTIKDYSSGEFLQKVTVSAGGLHSTTGVNGKFSIKVPITQVDDMTIQLNFFKEGYSNLSRLYPIQKNINVLLKKENL